MKLRVVRWCDRRWAVGPHAELWAPIMKESALAFFRSARPGFANDVRQTRIQHCWPRRAPKIIREEIDLIERGFRLNKRTLRFGHNVTRRCKRGAGGSP